MPNYHPLFIRHLLEYMAWSDRAGLDAARALDEGEYYKGRGFSFGSIHNLLVHQMVAQETWLERVKGRPRLGRLQNETEYPKRELLVERWPKLHRSLLEFAGGQTERSLNEPMTVRRNNGEEITLALGAILMHVADHGSYHRGQLASMFKQAGATPPYAPYFRYAHEFAATDAAAAAAAEGAAEGAAGGAEGGAGGGAGERERQS